MKLSFSNIAWSASEDHEMYSFLADNEFDGVEIAPSRLFPTDPYSHIREAEVFSSNLMASYGLEVSSVQSVWYQREERLFGSAAEREALLGLTKRVIEFAEALKCHNIVFGSPKNRVKPKNVSMKVAYDFFEEIATYAILHDTFIALEPNPTIYGTNFINNTKDAFNFARNVKGLRVNVDLGTLLSNEEGVDVVEKNISLVNHVHISEPYLLQIEEHRLHVKLSEVLRNTQYNRFVSVEMKNFNDVERVKKVAHYIREVFK